MSGTSSIDQVTAPSADGVGTEFRASILLLSYKMASTIVEAIEGALSQTVPCEIIVSDDASGDEGHERALNVAASYRGPHRLVIRRNERNLGLCEHINVVAAMARSPVFVFMSGDDVSYPFRVQKLLEVFAERQDVFALGSVVDEIDVNGNVIARGRRGMRSPMIQTEFLHCGKFLTLLGASMAVRRELLIGMPALSGMVEDHMLTLRGSLFGPVLCLRESLLKYRLHQSNLAAWVYARNEKNTRRTRYLRTIRLYRETADDHQRCLDFLLLDGGRLAVGRQVVSMYRLEADARAALLQKPRLAWIPFIWKGLLHPGLRRKSFERLWKLFIPKSWMGI